jgi:hypothetical protein
MGLLKVQQELAAILMEPAARKAFRDDPAGSLRARGVRGRDLQLLAGLVPDDLAYFAERRNIDRLQALRADAPRSTRLFEDAHGRLNAYFRAHPYSLEDPRKETERFARWCRQAVAREGSLPAVLPDLAAYEAAVLRLLVAKPKAATANRRPRRAPGVKLLRLRHRIGPALRADDPRKAEPAGAAGAWMALHRTADDVCWFGLSAVEAALLRSASGNASEAAWLKAAAAAAGTTPVQARKAARELAADGLLCPPA